MASGDSSGQDVESVPMNTYEPPADPELIEAPPLVKPKISLQQVNLYSYVHVMPAVPFMPC